MTAGYLMGLEPVTFRTGVIDASPPDSDLKCLNGNMLIMRVMAQCAVLEV
jgi:hypothetical protein